MTSFLEKLKKKKAPLIEEEEKKEKKAKQAQREIPEGFLQLEVDIRQTPNEIIIYAPMAGVDTNNLEVVMEEDNDVITIQGDKDRPSLSPGAREEKWLIQECEWGSFFRQIILPREVDSSKITAKFKKGVLMLKLPFMKEKEQKETKKVRMSDIG